MTAELSTCHQLREDLAFLRDEYGIRVKMGRENDLDRSDDVVLRKHTLLSANPAVRTVREEFSRIPPEYIKTLNITRLRLARILYYKGTMSEAVTFQSKHVYFASKENLRRTIHHELWHVGDKWPNWFLRLFGFTGKFDKEWDKINPLGRRVYLRDRYDLENEYHDRKIPGFARRYGMMDEREDRATIAEELMTKPGNLFERTETDDVLKAKVNRIIQLYEQRSNGKMNLDYFKELAALQGETLCAYCFGVIPE